jgi:hypothetical protein
MISWRRRQQRTRENARLNPRNKIFSAYHIGEKLDVRT